VAGEHVSYTGHIEGHGILVDPDCDHCPDGVGPVVATVPLREDAPVPFLHSKFSRFMDLPDPSTPWDQEVSSVLLFGPPGTSKSTLARSLAQKLGWHFLEVSPSDFIIGGLEHIEQKAKDLFQDLSSIRETVILLDEVDSLFVDRDLLSSESVINFVVPAMLPKLQDLNTRAKNQRLLIVIATNFYDRLDQAMVRPGRIDKHLLVLPYNQVSKACVLTSLLGDHADVLDSAADRQKVMSSTDLFVFQELHDLARKLRRDPIDSVHFTPSSINPSWYLSRVPQGKNRRRVRSKGTTRLALEICEVTSRLIGEQRTLTPGDPSKRIIEALDRRAAILGAHGLREWEGLCHEILRSLGHSPDSEVAAKLDAESEPG
jgi:hypothetical protein